jgi:hypothetical protein
MAIIDIQRRAMEAGRIRFGNKVGNRPNRLDHPLITSADQELIETVANRYAVKWSVWPGDESQWQVEIHKPLNILVPVSPEPCVQWWERWSGGGCMRRCDGVTDTINEQPCDCDKAAEKRACSPTSRIPVLLPETGDAIWRIESKSLNFAATVLDQLKHATGEKSGEVIPGVLTVEQRNGKKGKVPVPVIKLSPPDPLEGVRYRFNESGAGAGSPVPEAVEAPQPPPAVSVPESSVGGDSGTLISQGDIARLMVEVRAADISEADLKALVKEIAGVTSRKLITKDKYPALLQAVKDRAGELFPSERQGDL